MPDDDTTLHERIRSLGKEFRFATRCLQTAINDEADLEDPKWSCFFNVPEPQGPPLFTESIRHALLWLMATELAVPSHIIFHSWFVENKVTMTLAKTLMDILTADFLRKAYTADGFLRHCATMAELSALCHFAGSTNIPEYAIGCLLYAIDKNIERNELNWSSVVAAAEGMIQNAEEPSVYFQRLMKSRGSVLETYTSE